MGLQPPSPWAKEEPGTLDLLKMDKRFSKKSEKGLLGVSVPLCLFDFSDMEIERRQESVCSYEMGERE